MDTVKTGAFIAELRRGQNLTQKELADRLAVTDKAVSRWETGKGLPDAALLQPLSEALGVSVGELLAGERMPEQEVRERTDAVILDSLRYSGRTVAKTVSGLLLFVGAVLLVLPLYTTGVPLLRWLWLPGLVLILLAIVRIVLKKRGRTIRPNDRALYLISIILLTAALVIEILPVGSVMVFGGPDGDFVDVFSFFSLLPVGYANFIPFLMGLLTSAALLLSVLSYLKFEGAPKARNAAFLCTLCGALLYLALLLLYGVKCTNFFGFAVFLDLAVSAVLQAIANRKTEALPQRKESNP